MTDIDLAPLRLSLPEIDEDHAASVALWRAARDAEAAAFPARFEAFLVHLAEHFAREEGLMKAAGYRDLAHHAGEHARVLGEARRFLAQARAGRAMMARAFVADFVPDWFRRHVLMFDAEVARAVRGAGLAVETASAPPADGAERPTSRA